MTDTKALRDVAERLRVPTDNRREGQCQGRFDSEREEAADAIDDLLSRLESAGRAVDLALDTITAMMEVASQARDEWDAAPAGMKAGKLLIALIDPSLNYRLDISAIHANRAKLIEARAALSRANPQKGG